MCFLATISTRRIILDYLHRLSIITKQMSDKSVIGDTHIPGNNDSEFSVANKALDGSLEIGIN